MKDKTLLIITGVAIATYVAYNKRKAKKIGALSRAGRIGEFGYNGNYWEYYLNKKKQGATITERHLVRTWHIVRGDGFSEISFLNLEDAQQYLRELGFKRVPREKYTKTLFGEDYKD